MTKYRIITPDTLTDKQRAAILGRITSLQNSRDYAAPEVEMELTAEINRLFRQLERGKR